VITIEHDSDLIEVSIFGEFRIEDYKKFESEVTMQVQEQGKMNLLIDLQGMLGYTVDVALEDIKFTREHAHDVGRVAMVSNQDWVAWMALATRIFLDADLRVFDDEADARAWLIAD
jgi:hypothetical protein